MKGLFEQEMKGLFEQEMNSKFETVKVYSSVFKNSKLNITKKRKQRYQKTFTVQKVINSIKNICLKKFFNCKAIVFRFNLNKQFHPQSFDENSF